MQKYKIINILGDGAFGTVFKAVNSKTNEVVAIKKMKSKYKNWEECLELREIKALRKLNHPNIIKLKQVLLVSEELHFVFQYLETNLYEEYATRKKQERPFTQQQIKNLLFQLASALAHMHKNGFFHRDLKPQNLLIYGDVLKICDFGLARQIRSRPPFTDYVSTRYRSPELLLRSTNYNSPVDVFAFGCIAAELYNLAPLFPGNNDMDQLNKIVKALGTPDVREWAEGYKLAKNISYNFSNESGISLNELIPFAGEQAIDLIRNTFMYSSRKRLTMAEILKHDYFRGISLPSETERKRDIIFEQKQEGKVLDLSKHQKKIEEFRMTKQKFRQTRKQDAFKADLFKNIEKFHPKKQDPSLDIDDIIKQLEDKKKRPQKDLRPIKVTKATRQKFYTQADHHYGDKNKQEDKYCRKIENYQRQQFHKKYNSNNYEPGFKKQPHKNNIFGFGFQPASVPFLMPFSQQKEYNKYPISPIVSKGRGVNLSTNNNIYKDKEDKTYRPKGLFPIISPFRY